jgi:hypothetical protein
LLIEISIEKWQQPYVNLVDSNKFLSKFFLGGIDENLMWWTSLANPNELS